MIPDQVRLLARPAEYEGVEHRIEPALGIGRLRAELDIGAGFTRLHGAVVTAAHRAALAQGQFGRGEIGLGRGDRLNDALFHGGHEFGGIAPHCRSVWKVGMLWSCVAATWISSARIPVCAAAARWIRSAISWPVASVSSEQTATCVEPSQHQGPDFAGLANRLDTSLLSGWLVKAGHLDAQRWRDVGHTFACEETIRGPRSSQAVPRIAIPPAIAEKNCRRCICLSPCYYCLTRERSVSRTSLAGSE